jgi:hypothetical protein
MNTIISMHALKDFAPGLRNRDQNNNAKTAYVGGVVRARFSTASLKRPVRQIMFPETIVSAHLNDMIAIYIQDQIDAGVLNANDKEALQKAFEEAICIISKSGDKSDKKGKKTEAGAEKEETKKGRQAVSYQRQTLLAMLAAMTKDVVENGVPSDSRLFDVAKAVYNASPVDPCNALLGVMSTHDIMETVDAAVAIADAIGINRYAGDTDYWTHAGYAGSVDSSTPKFMRMWQEKEQENPGSENLGFQDITSDTMYQYAHVDVRTFVQNMQRHDAAAGCVTDVTPIAQKTFTDFFTLMMTTAPAAKQATNASMPACEIAYFEVIENGQPVTMSWNSPVAYDKVNKTSIVSQGIDRVAMFAADDAFRTGDIKRYVILGAQHADKVASFEAAGVTVLKNLKELAAVLSQVTADAIQKL